MSGRIIIALLLLLLLGSRIITFFIEVFHTLLFRWFLNKWSTISNPGSHHTNVISWMFQRFSDQTNNKATPQSTDFTTPQYSQNFHLHLSRPTSYHHHHNHNYYHHDHHHHHLVQSSTTNNCQLFTRGSHVLPGWRRESVDPPNKPGLPGQSDERWQPPGSNPECLADHWQWGQGGRYMIYHLTHLYYIII